MWNGLQGVPVQKRLRLEGACLEASPINREVLRNIFNNRKFCSDVPCSEAPFSKCLANLTDDRPATVSGRAPRRRNENKTYWPLLIGAQTETLNRVNRILSVLDKLH